MNSENNMQQTNGDQGMTVRFSENAHVAILKKILSSEVKIPIWMFCLFLVNVFLSGWHLVERAIEKDTMTFFQMAFSDFDLSFDYFYNAMQSSFDYIPFRPLAMFLLNLVLLTALWRISCRMKITLAIKHERST